MKSAHFVLYSCDHSSELGCFEVCSLSAVVIECCCKFAVLEELQIRDAFGGACLR